jgi:hypothetical protein
LTWRRRLNDEDPGRILLLGIFSERATRVKEEGRMSIRAVVELSAIKGRDARVQAEWSGWIAEATSAELRDWWLR